MFRCLNGCGRVIGRGDPQPGDVLVCATCAAAINADYGRMVYRVDPGRIASQKARSEPLPPPYHSLSRSCGLTPLPLPRSRRRLFGRW